MNTKILASLLVIGAVGAVAGGTTFAEFTDVETGTADFEAGIIDMSLGLSNGNGIENDVMYNGQTAQLFNVGDMKPGDTNESTVALEVRDNPSWVCGQVEVTAASENGFYEPEKQTNDSGAPEGELQQHLVYTMWTDDGDNKYEGDSEGFNDEGSNDVDEQILVENEPVPTVGENWSIVDSGYNAFGPDGEPLPPNERKYIGVNVTFQDGADVNNAMSDTYKAGIELSAVQQRNNEDFTCSGEELGTQRNILEGTEGTTTLGDSQVSAIPEGEIDNQSTVALGTEDPNVVSGVTIEFYSNDNLLATNRIGTDSGLQADETIFVDIPTDVEGEAVEGFKLVGGTLSSNEVVVDIDGNTADGDVDADDYVFPVS